MFRQQFAALPCSAKPATVQIVRCGSGMPLNAESGREFHDMAALPIQLAFSGRFSMAAVSKS